MPDLPDSNAASGGAVWKRTLKLLLLAGVIIGAGYGVSWGIREILEQTTESKAREVPLTEVRRGPVTMTVNARGDIRGSNSETFLAPRTGDSELPIIFLREVGEWVDKGEVVVEFDATQQEYRLREAEADLEEAQQAVIQARAEAQAALEEARFQVIATDTEMRLAQQEIRKNELLAGVQRRLNEINLEKAKNNHRQAQEDYENRQASMGSGIAVKESAVDKARQEAELARRNIESLTMRAKSSGYVERMTNTTGVGILYAGMSLPKFRLGDTARPGQPVAAIPGMETWEVSVRVPETDRGYLQVGQPVVVHPAALPGQALVGHIAVLGGATGYSYNRTFECRVALDEVDPGLRPGLSADVEITVASLDDVLWVPSQALFDSDGRSFVYIKTDQGYIRQFVTLTRRSESQAVISGIEEGTLVTLAAPDQQDRAAEDPTGGALNALP